MILSHDAYIDTLNMFRCKCISTYTLVYIRLVYINPYPLTGSSGLLIDDVN